MTPPTAASLRDRLLEAEQLRLPIRVGIAGAPSVQGVVREVGLDHVSLETSDGLVDVAMFHIALVRW